MFYGASWSAEPGASPFADMAQELLDGLEREHSLQDKVLNSLNGQGKRQIAVWPFEGQPLPVPDRLAESWNDALIDGLVKNKPDDLRFITVRIWMC